MRTGCTADPAATCDSLLLSALVSSLYQVLLLCGWLQQCRATKQAQPLARRSVQLRPALLCVTESQRLYCAHAYLACASASEEACLSSVSTVTEPERSGLIVAMQAAELTSSHRCPHQQRRHTRQSALNHRRHARRQSVKVLAGPADTLEQPSSIRSQASVAAQARQTARALPPCTAERFCCRTAL